MVLLVLPARDQRPPVHPDDLDATEAPPVPLALERLEGQRHDAAAEYLVHVQPVPARPEQPQRQLRVLGDDPFVPAAELIQGQDPVAGQRAWAAADRMIVDRAAAVPYANNLALTLVSPRTGNDQSNPQWGVLLDQLWVR